jgi:hypothetical protein
MENLRIARRWLQEHWMGLIATYLLVLVMTYLAIWQIGEPVGISDNLDTLPSWMRRRIVFHLILTLLISSHITLILEVLFRRKIWRASVQDQKLRCEDYGIEILFPETGQIVEQHFEVIGTFEKKPHPESLKLFVIDIDNQYWPQSENIRFDVTVQMVYELIQH